MFDLKNLDSEFDYVKNIKISNISELESFRSRYFSKDGILPEIYRSISKIRGPKSQKYLLLMLELRHSVDQVINKYGTIL